MIGKWKHIPERFFKYADYLIFFAVILLLFSMGIEIGLNKAVIKELPMLGWKAFLIALLSVIFSVIFIHFIVNKIMFSTRKDKIDYDLDTNS